jgi:hypothetical protein
MDIVGMRRGGSCARSWLPVRPPLVWSFPPDQGQPSHATCCADVTPAVHCYAKARCYLSFDENAVFNASSVATSALMPHWKFCNQLDKAMIHTSHRDRKAKAIAEVLAMIDADLPLAPHRPRPVLETEEWLFESATEFIEAREKYYAERATQIKRKNH